MRKHRPSWSFGPDETDFEQSENLRSVLNAEREAVEHGAQDVVRPKDLAYEKYDDEPFYFTADDVGDVYRNNHNLALNVNINQRPTYKELVRTVIHPRSYDNILFEQGMWVEYRHNDMFWKGGVVNRVTKQAAEDSSRKKNRTADLKHISKSPNKKLHLSSFEAEQEDYEIWYNIGVEGLVSEDDIRAPRKGLEVVFGMRPWLWQQFTLLLLEKRMRFQADHEYDFEIVDSLSFAKRRYVRWLHAKENVEFKEWHDSQPEFAQELLRQHILTPFKLLDSINEDEKKWNFKDIEISLYTYWNLLGSGSVFCICVMAIQVISPLVILYSSLLLADDNPNPRFEVGEDFLPLNGNFLPSTSFDTFCLISDDTDPEGVFLKRTEGKILACLVVMIYLFSVVPDSAMQFYRTSGIADSTSSRIQSLRNLVWERDGDRVSQQVGLSTDAFMSTGYVALLYSIMLFVLLNTPLPLDIVLNSLAIEFIHRIDERLAASDWYDGDKRWLKAGTVEAVFQANLPVHVLRDKDKLCKVYQISKDKLRKPLFDEKQAKLDEDSPRYQTRRERIYSAVARVAKQTDNDFVHGEYHEKLVNFSLIDRFKVWVGIRRAGVFHRYHDYRVWSRWEEALFLPRVPKGVPKTLLSSAKAKKHVDMLMGEEDVKELITDTWRILFGVELFIAVSRTMQNGNYEQIPFRLYLGFLDILNFWVQIVFPFFIVGWLFFFPFCY